VATMAAEGVAEVAVMMVVGTVAVATMAEGG
jgi:hypothetical protein